MLSTSLTRTRPSQSTPSTTDTTLSTSEAEVEVTYAKGNPSKVDKKLSPDGLWFHEPSVTKMVTHSFMSFFREPHMNWSSTLEHVRLRWRHTFRQEYNWDAEEAENVKALFAKKCRRCLSDMVSKIGRIPEYKAQWCPPSVREAIRAKREKPEFQKKSTQCYYNKKSFQKVGTLQSQGSISTQFLKRKLKRRLGHEVSAAEVFKAGHERKDGKFINQRSELLWESFETRKTMVVSDGETQEKSSLPTDNELFYELAGGIDKKGRVYGLGDANECYFEKPSLPSTYPLQEVVPRSCEGARKSGCYAIRGDCGSRQKA